jgi:hypothetical protein
VKTIGGINVVISATTDKFSKGVGKARGVLSSFTKSISKTQAALGVFGVALSAGAVARGLTNTINKIADLSEASKRMGISTEVLGGLQLAAEEAGVSTSQLEKATVLMVRASARAAEGAGRIADTYERLGLNAKALHAMAPDQQLAMIAGGISGLSTHQEKLNAATQIFGKGASSMLGLLEKYPSRLAEATEAAKAMGLVIKDEIAAQIESAVDSMGRFKKALGGFGTAVVTQNADKISAVAEVLEGFALNQHWKKGASPFDALFHGPASVLNNNVTSGPAFVESDPIRAARSAGGSRAAAAMRAQMKAAGLLHKPGVAGSGLNVGRLGRRFLENLLNNPVVDMGPKKFAQKANPFIGRMRTDEATRRRPPEPLRKVSGGMTSNLLGLIGPAMRTFQLEGMKQMLALRAQMGIANLMNGQMPSNFTPGHRSFAAHDPLSREGHAQRVRALSQTGNKVQQQQLGTQKKMEEHLRKMAAQPQVQLAAF